VRAVGRGWKRRFEEAGIDERAGCEAKPEMFVASYGVEARRN
jgi:hypothetical protein